MEAGHLDADKDIEIYQEIHNKKHIILLNKADKFPEEQHPDLLKTAQNRFPKSKILLFSALKGTGLKELESYLQEAVQWENIELEDVVMVQERVKNLLHLIQNSINEFLQICQDQAPQEIQAIPLREAIQSLSEISGKIGNEDILGSIFRRFCIGK